MKPFGCVLRKSHEKHNGKHWVSHSNLMWFRDLAKVEFSLEKTATQTNAKLKLRNPYKHCRLRRLLEAFCEKVTKTL